MVKTPTLAFSSFRYNFIKNIFAKFGIRNLRQSPDIGQNLNGSISDFRISGQSLIKENCHNSRTSDDIDMKLRPITKIDKRNKATSKKFDDEVILKSCDVIVIFPIYDQSGAIRRLKSRSTACKTHAFINGNF